MEKPFVDRHVVVTGGTGGLGITVVQALVEAGAHVHLPMADGRVPEALASLPRIALRPNINLTDEAAVAHLYAELPGLYASIHLVGGFAAAPIAEVSLADVRAQFDINFVTCFLACREAVRTMRKTPGGGRIVNVAAKPVLAPVGGMVAYTSAKAAVASLTQCLADEVRGDSICVNAIVPSIIDTPANRKSMPNADFTRWPTPAQIAETILFLAGPANALTSGALIPVYGRA